VDDISARVMVGFADDRSAKALFEALERDKGQGDVVTGTIDGDVTV
jgi:hypothetical protein